MTAALIIIAAIVVVGALCLLYELYCRRSGKALAHGMLPATHFRHILRRRCVAGRMPCASAIRCSPL